MALSLSLCASSLSRGTSPSCKNLWIWVRQYVLSSLFSSSPSFISMISTTRTSVLIDSYIKLSVRMNFISGFTIIDVMNASASTCRLYFRNMCLQMIFGMRSEYCFAKYEYICSIRLFTLYHPSIWRTTSYESLVSVTSSNNIYTSNPIPYITASYSSSLFVASYSNLK